jgi:ABC-type dipeptide/oligopeptide/nickel transport system ATPase component
MSISIKVGDRWAIIGGTGSGKTVLTNEVIKTYYSATAGRVPQIIIDSKITGDFNHLLDKRLGVGQLIRGNDPEKAVKEMYKKPFTVWQPEDDFTMYDAFFRGIYLNGRNKNLPAIITTDELSSICNGAGKAPRHWEILNKQGRAMHIGMLNLTQSPSFVPPSLLRQVTHAVRMQLNDDYDVKKLAKVMGRAVEEAPLDDYGFWYRSCLKPTHKSPPIYFSDYKDFI